MALTEATSNSRKCHLHDKRNSETIRFERYTESSKLAGLCSSFCAERMPRAIDLIVDYVSADRHADSVLGSSQSQDEQRCTPPSFDFQIFLEKLMHDDNKPLVI